TRSSTVTRGSARNRGWSCPWPTSSAITRAAPRCNKTSVKPPVEAPTSRQSSPVGSTPSASRACASFSPPRETYGGGAVNVSSAGRHREEHVTVLERVERLDRARHRRVHLPAERAELPSVEPEIRHEQRQRRVPGRRPHRPARGQPLLNRGHQRAPRAAPRVEVAEDDIPVAV